MNETPWHLHFDLDYWAAESVDEGADQVELLLNHIRRAQARLGLLIAASLIVLVFSVAMEYARIQADGTAISLWRSLMGMVPGLLGLLALVSTSAELVRDIYGIQNQRAAMGTAWMLLFGHAPFSVDDQVPSDIPIAPYPSMTVREGRIDERYVSSPLVRLGGPGRVTIFNDSAVFLERFGRFTRVAGPGTIFLRRFERIREVMDLRPQEQTLVAKALTKDGLPVETELQVRFQLARPPADLVPTSPQVPYPVHEWALIRAGRCHKRSIDLEDGTKRIARWSEQMGVAEKMREVIAEYWLDELLEPYEPGWDPRQEISQRLRAAVNGCAREVGAEVLEVRLGPLEPTSPEITQGRITSWQTDWNSEARREKLLHAEGIQEQILAQAYAQMEIFLSLAREFQDAIEQEVTLPAEIIILRFMEALRQARAAAGDTSASSQMPEMWHALEEELQQLVGPAYLLLPEEAGEQDSPESQEHPEASEAQPD